MKYLFCLWSVLVLTACFSSRNYNAQQQIVFDKQGHRGCRGLMPENTIPAMLKALDLGVTTLETDVVITRDSQVILSHEPFFNHEITTAPDGVTITTANEKQFNIYQMTYDQVKRFDVGLKPNPRFPKQSKLPAIKPLLGAMIDSVKAYCQLRKRPLPYFNIETKTQPATDLLFHPAVEPFVERLMQVIHQKGIAAQVIIQSFDTRTLQYLHTNYPSIKIALLVEGADKKPLALQLQSLGFIPNIYSPNASLITPLLIKQCKDASIRLIPWTVNDAASIRQLRQMGVDGIITDYPDLFE